jgi:hypothetical protein
VKVQIVTAYRVRHWQRYGDTVRGNVTIVYPHLESVTRTLAGRVKEARERDAYSCQVCVVYMVYGSVSQTVVLGFCLCGPLRLNVSPKKTEKY